MTALFPVYTILPGKTRLSDAVALANTVGVGIWLTPRGKHVLAPEGRPGWRRLNIRTQETTPCAA
jgi:hypothetical protein